ncbi:MAG: hypothetical protein JXR49_17550 [Acidobacteria bacterium]|nr:hypothetical protein [Acidobacteriota bacterium]
MNKLQQAVAVLKSEADTLFGYIWILLGPGARTTGDGKPLHRKEYGVIVYDSKYNHIDPKDIDPKSYPAVVAITSILKSCIRREMPEGWDLDLLNKAIAEAPLSLAANKSKNGIVLAFLRGGALWLTANALARYVNTLTEDSPLRPYEPIGICPHCDGIFLKRRTDQEFCTVQCRSDAWVAKKGKKYFAQKARESRARKAKTSAKPGVGKIVGELSTKSTKTRRKTKKR